MGDLLYELTEWLRTTPLTEFALAMSEAPLTLWITTNFWAIPILQVIHILSIAGSFAAVLMINLRIFGFAGHATMAETANRYSRVLWVSLAVVLLSGVLMLFGDTVRNLLNSVFWIKMILVVIGVLSAILFLKSMKRRLTSGEVVGGGDKAVALFLAILWCVIMLAGRWIAYAPA